MSRLSPAVHTWRRALAMTATAMLAAGIAAVPATAAATLATPAAHSDPAVPKPAPAGPAAHLGQPSSATRAPALLAPAQPAAPTGAPFSSAWTFLGPAPIPNGQLDGNAANAVKPVTGRVTAIAVDPTDPNVVYVGGADGGVWRSTTGGSAWTPIFDSAGTLAIGSLALAPSDHTILYVGTGEGNQALDSFAGQGLYRIDAANGAAPAVTGPLNPANIFAGQAIQRVLVSPTDPAVVFVATTFSFTGIGGQLPPVNNLGLFRSTNATSSAAAVSFTKLPVAPSAHVGPGDFRPITDIAFQPGSNPLRLYAAKQSFGSFGDTPADGGLYVTANATAATVTFTQTQQFNANDVRATFATTPANPSYVLVATSEVDPALPGSHPPGGLLRASTDGGVSWSGVPAASGFCATQCYYDIAVAMDPSDVGPGVQPDHDVILLGGTANGAAAAANIDRSADGGATFANSDTLVHTDTHVVVPAGAGGFYTGNDGGVWRSANDGASWGNDNASPLSLTQFVGMAVHPTDPRFTLGGTQDNGTVLRDQNGTFSRVDSGDGGYAAIDQNATDTTNVTLYHTYFNTSGSQVGYATATGIANATDGGWTFRGCNVTAGNGIGCADKVNFYAPLVLGPGNPNSVYFGTDRVYRSTDTGATNTVLSPGVLSAGTAISSIAVSPQDDNVRLAGLDNGKVFSWNGTTFADVTGTIPTVYVGRVAIDPNVKTTAYVALANSFGNGSAHIYKTTNLNAPAPLWAAASAGIPDVAVNSLVVDPANSNSLYAATQVGVFGSVDGGQNWSPVGTGLPAVAVFDLAVAAPRSSNEVLRIATHGRGMWEIPLSSGPPPAVPEGPVALALPVVALGAGASIVMVRRRRRLRRPALRT